MNFDFALLLVVLTALAGVIWLIDHRVFAPRRQRAALEIGEMTALAEDERKTRIQAALREPVVTEYARSFFPVLFVILLLRSFVAEPFKIPSGSMIPTLRIGDFILVNKFAYGLRLPVLNNRFLDLGSPQRGDVMVFRYPGHSCERGGQPVRSLNPCNQPIQAVPHQNYIKRVIGLPGDEITYRNKILYVNGEEIVQQYIGPYTGPSEQTQSLASGRVSDEKLGSEAHRMMTLPSRPPDREGTWTVPDASYFVMGDNRDSSADSRSWGFVPEQNLVGRAMIVWMNWDGGLFSPDIDLGRIGTVVR